MAVKHTIRTNLGGEKQVELTRGTAILAFCTECMGHGAAHPKDCTAVHCPLYPFRGKTLMGYEKGEEEVG